MNYKAQGKLSVAEELLQFVNNELLPGTNVDPIKFWTAFDEAAHELSTINKKLLLVRK